MNNVLTLEELFSGKVLVVPEYQRGYAWDRPQWDDLLDDLEYLASAKHHYAGTVVLDPDGAVVCDAEGRNNDVFHVVDGQQRLTTVVVLLECIRLRMAEANATLAAGIRKSYIEFTDLNQQSAQKLRLNCDSHDFFVNSILSEPASPGGPLTASQERLKDAKAYFEKYLDQKEAVEGQSYKKWLLEFYFKLIRQLRVSLYVVEQASEVGVIFEVMNNRGKQLSELDKAKNYLMYVASKLELKAPHDLAGLVNGTWSEIFRSLMAFRLNSSDDEERLLRAHWLMAYNPDRREFHGSNSIKEKYNLKVFHKKHKKLLDELSNYTRTLRETVAPFCEAFGPSHDCAFKLFREPDRSEVRKAGEKLRRLNVVAPFLPVLTACRLRFPDDSEKYLALLRLAEMFAFRVYKVMQRRSDAGQTELFRLGHDLYHQEVSFDDLLVRIRHLALWFCSNKQFRDDSALDDVESDWYNWGSLKYVLYEYEEHLAGSKGVKVPWHTVYAGDTSTLEHILPQTVDGANGAYWRQRFDARQRRRLTHDIGNLCLTEDNSVYGNKPFTDKKGKPGAGRCYANSNFFEERNLASYTDWTEKTLLRRRKNIVAWYLDRWNLDDSDMTDEQFAEDDAE